MPIFTDCEPLPRVPAHTREWHTQRSQGIGGSDAPIILGISPWTTAKQLWELKTGRAEPGKSSALMEIGTFLEEHILHHAFAGEEVHEGGALGAVRSKAYPFLRANVDGFMEDKTIIEIKCTGKMWTRAVPDNYYAQVQHYMGVLGAPRAKVVNCCFEKPLDRATLLACIQKAGADPAAIVRELGVIQIYTVQADQAWWRDYLPKAQEFWRAVQEDAWQGSQYEAPF